jgi:hypothetical protein
MKKETLTPKTANTFNKIGKLKRDNVSTRKSWMYLAGTGALNILQYRTKRMERKEQGWLR